MIAILQLEITLNNKIKIILSYPKIIYMELIMKINKTLILYRKMLL